MKKNKQRIVTLEQWAEVEICDGRTKTTLYPSNQELAKKGKDMDPQPDMVYRRINFRGSVPIEYYWTTSDPTRRRRGGHCIQRMSVETWLKVSAIEELRTGKHLGPCGGILPRPPERGGCDCPQCTAATARLEAQSHRNTRPTA
ncbi:MAG TPA: hypothetical protein VK604_07085 [Bryobacteraceae bacterium]|nr:hypothetical protein [Bryobacteraceae bacterium]